VNGRFIVFDERVRQGPLDRLRIAVEHTRALTSGRSATGLSHDDADDDVGSIATDSACGFDPFPLLWALHEAGARAVVIGQVAGIMHGSVELTGDLDLLWDGDPAKVEALTQAFGAVNCRLLDDDREPVALGPRAFTLPKIQYESSSVSGDCCTPALRWGSLPVRDFLARALATTGADGLKVHYLRREDLAAMRQAAGRAKDLRRNEELERLYGSASAPRVMWRQGHPVDHDHEM
jgi:hypothetical protein